MLRLGVLLASVVAMVLAVVLSLHDRQSSTFGYNGARPTGFVATVAPGKPVCSPLGSGRLTPDRVQVTVGTNGVGRQPLRATVPGGAAGATVTAGDGVVTLPLPAGASERGTVCVENRGRRPLLLAGEPSGNGSTIGGRLQGYLVAYVLVDGAPPRWSADAGGMLDRVGQARAGAGGSSTGYVVVILVGLALLGALGAAWRWAR